MDVKQFEEVLSKAKIGFFTGRISEFKLYRSEEGRKWIYKVKGITVLGVEFYQSIEHMSIFQAELLYMLYVQNRKPSDYAGFHKSPAGRKFIENILEVIVPKPTHECPKCRFKW